MTYTHSITAYTNPALIWDREKKDIEYSRCIGLYIVFNEINALVQQLFEMYDIPYGLVKAGIMGILLLIFARSILHFNRKEYIALLTAFGIVSFLYAYSALVGASVSYMASWAVSSFGVGVPLGTFAYLIEDKGKLYSFLYKCTWPVLPMAVLDFAFNHRNELGYSLHFGYMMLFILIFHLSHMLSEKKWAFVPLLFAELALIFLFGSRTALICLAAYIAIRFITIPGMLDKKIIVIGSILVLIPIVIFLFRAVIPELVTFLQSKGFYARSLDMLVDNNFANVGDRTYIWVEDMQLINQRPLFGWGIREYAKRSQFVYPHQFFLECWESFGYIFGTIIAAVVVFFIARALRSDRSVDAELCRIYVSMEFTKLMVSQSFITSYQFYIMMGLLVSYSFYRRKTAPDNNRITEIVPD